MYSMHPYMRERWGKVERRLAYEADEETAWRDWRREAEATLRKLLGYDTLLHTLLQPHITEEQQLEGYRRQRVEIQTEPGVVMPSISRSSPTQGGPRYPAIIAPHGHGGGGKVAVAGIRDDPLVAQAIDQYNYDYGVQFVRAGFIVFCPDARGFGERQEEAGQGQHPQLLLRLYQRHGLPPGPDHRRDVGLGHPPADRLYPDARRLPARPPGLRRALGRWLADALGRGAGQAHPLRGDQRLHVRLQGVAAGYARQLLLQLCAASLRVPWTWAISRP